MRKKELVPSLIIVLMGSIDCLTTAIGVTYFGAVELNPLLAGIVNTNIVAFLVIKMSATFLIGFTYITAKKTLMKASDKNSKSFRVSHKLIRFAYVGLVLFLVTVVLNNLIVLAA